MATARGRWLVDQMSARFGACVTAVGAGLSVTWGAVWVPAVVGVVVELDVAEADDCCSNWRAVTVNDRFERCSGSNTLGAAARSREAYIVVVGCGGLVKVASGPGPGDECELRLACLSEL